MEPMYKKYVRVKMRPDRIKEVVAYAASLMLVVPPAVCESVLNEFYSSVKKSFGF